MLPRPQCTSGAWWVPSAPYSSAYAQGRPASREQLHVNATHCLQCHWPFSSFFDECASNRVKPSTGLAQPGLNNAQLVLPTGRMSDQVWSQPGKRTAKAVDLLCLWGAAPMVGIPTRFLHHYLPQSEQSRHQRECNPSFGTDEEEQEQEVPTQQKAQEHQYSQLR